MTDPQWPGPDEHEILDRLPRKLRDPIVENLYIPVIGHAGIFAKLRDGEQRLVGCFVCTAGAMMMMMMMIMMMMMRRRRRRRRRRRGRKMAIDAWGFTPWS
jgi:hypothetical protein